MHEMKEKLIKAGTDILNASKTELYVSMRFLDIALNSLGYEMDLSMKTIGTDSQKIRFNPRYLIENYQNDSVLVNRAYLHMLLHCLYLHLFREDQEDRRLWNLACDIAVEQIISREKIPILETGGDAKKIREKVFHILGDSRIPQKRYAGS